jgi:hypothetical protein
MKLNLGTFEVPTIVFIFILFVTLGILLLTLPLPQFTYAHQMIENELIENTLEMVEEATDEQNTLETLEKATSSSLDITESFGLKNITNNLNNDNTTDGGTLEEQLKLLQQRLNQLGIGAFNTSKLDIDLGFPPVDFSNMLENAGSLVSVE